MSRSGHLPPVTVATWCVRPGRRRGKRRVSSVYTCAPRAMWAPRNGFASALEILLATSMATAPIRPLRWRSAAATTRVFGGAAARVALTSEIDVVGLGDRRPAAPTGAPDWQRSLSSVIAWRSRLCRYHAEADFKSGDTLLGAVHQLHGPEPDDQRQLGVGHHCARGDRAALVVPRSADPTVVGIAFRIGAARAGNARVPGTFTHAA